MSVADPRYTVGRGIQALTPEGRDLLQRCIAANPNGCRSADGECGPPPTYPCFMMCGLSSEDWRVFWGDERDRMAARNEGTQRGTDAT